MCVCMGSAFRSLGFSLLFGAYVPGELGQIKYRFFGGCRLLAMLPCNPLETWLRRPRSGAWGFRV